MVTALARPLHATTHGVCSQTTVSRMSFIHLCTSPMGDAVLGPGFPVDISAFEGLMVTLHNLPMTTAELEANIQVDHVTTKAGFPSLANGLMRELGHKKAYVEFNLTANEEGTIMPEKTPFQMASSEIEPFLMKPWDTTKFTLWAAIAVPREWDGTRDVSHLQTVMTDKIFIKIL